jgi:hypothetical protein
VIFEVEDQALYVAEAFLEHPEFMIGRSDIMEYANNQLSFYSFATASSVLQYLLPLTEQNECLLEAAHIYLALGLVVDVLDLADEVFFIQ